jgi:hypothetical protein
MRIWLIIIALLSFAAAQNTQPADMVLQRVAKVDQFAFGGTGYSGAISPGEKDYKIILARTSAAADFEKLYSEGNLQAKCYALVGIHKLNAVRFKDLATPMRSSRKIVAIMHGCIVSEEAFGDVIKQIESGRYAL